MDIKKIIEEKIEGGKKDLALLAEDSKNALSNETKITLLRGEISAYCDCLTLIEQSEKPMKPIPHSYYHKCPKCGEYLASTYPHCPYCGQPLDWGEGEKK
jgi:endogenous inhibitor of DNA gyrase (YacG/DUF329 family)